MTVVNATDVCYVPALKHSPSKKKSTNSRSRSVTATEGEGRIERYRTLSENPDSGNKQHCIGGQ